MMIEPGLPPGRNIRLEGIDTAGLVTRVDQLRLTPAVNEFRTLGEKTCVSCKANVWGVNVTDLDKIRVYLRNVSCSMVDGVVDKKAVFGRRHVVKPGHDKILRDRLWSIAEVLCGAGGLAFVVEVRLTVGRGPEVIDEWQHAGLQIGNRTTARPSSRRHQALASAAIRHNRDLAQR